MPINSAQQSPNPNPISPLVSFLPPQSPNLQINKGRNKCRTQYPRHNEEMPRQTRLRLKLDVVIAHGPPSVPPLVLFLVRSCVACLVKVRYCIVWSRGTKGVGARSHASVLGMSEWIAPWARIRIRLLRLRSCFLVRFFPSVRVSAPSSVFVKTRRGTAKGASSSGEARGTPPARGIGAVIRCSRVGVRVPVMRLVQAEGFPVVFRAAGGIGEDGV